MTRSRPRENAYNSSNRAAIIIEWERWAAELLESQLSFPVLSFYRSQHENRSWVGTLTAIFDTSALLIVGVEGPDGYQARLTFAMARRAAVDLAMVFQTPPLPPEPNRLFEAKLAQLRESLSEAGLSVRRGISGCMRVNHRLDRQEGRHSIP